VYRDAGDFGDDRVYVVRRGVVRASYPYPATPIEHEAFRGVMAQEMSQDPPSGAPLPLESIDEVLLMMSWFRAHPEALRRTTPFEQWM
jgi:excinuclease ABC subunit C